MKRPPSKTRESDRARGPLSRGALMTERAPRDRCRLPAPSKCLDGRVATSVPTAASIAVAELGPLAWPASSLRLFSHGHAGSRDTAGRAAPSVRVPSATPGLSTDCKLHGPLLHRPRPRLSPDQEDRLGVLRALISLLASCSALLPAPAGSFQKGGVTHFQRLALLAARGKNRRENPRAIGIPSSFSWRYWNPLFLFLGRDGFISGEVAAGLWRR